MIKEARRRITIPLLGICMMALYMILCSTVSHGAALKEAEKCFFAEGQKIVINAVTDEDRENDPEGTAGKSVKITCYDPDGSQVEDTYYITSDYTVYGGGSDTDCANAEIEMNSGKLHRIVAGGRSGDVDHVQLTFYGGSVEQVVLAEDGVTKSSNVTINNDADSTMDIWIGAEKNHKGSINSIYLNANDNSTGTLHMGYSAGKLLSQINESRSREDYVQVMINGSNLNGLNEFEAAVGFLVNNKKTFLLEGRKGHFDKGEESILHQVSFLDKDGSLLESVEADKVFPKPERKGYTFEGWISTTNQLTPEEKIYNWADGYLSAIWHKNDDPEPYDCSVVYFDPTNPEMEMRMPVFFEDGVRALVPKGFDREKGLTLQGCFPDGSRFSEPIEDYDPETGVWYYMIESQSVDKKVKKNYIVSVYEADYRESSWGLVTVSDPKSYDESTGSYETSNTYYVDREEALSKDGATLVLPYKSMQNKWHAEFSFHMPMGTDDIGIKDGEQYVQEYVGEIALDGKTKISKLYELKTEDGKVHDYRINLEESDGSDAELCDLAVITWDGKSYDDDGQMVYMSKTVNLEEAATEKGTEVVIPYYYDEKTCGGIELISNASDSEARIKGLKDSYTLDSKGERVIEFSTISANGKNSKKYKIKLVKDKTGDNTAFETLNLHYMELSKNDDGADIEIPIDMEAAKSEAGATVVVPVNAPVNAAGFFVQGNTKNYATVDLTGYDYIDWEPDVYKRPGKYNKLSDSVEFTVTSANQKHTQKYKITVWQKDAKQFKDISKVKISGIKSQVYTGSPLKPELILTDGGKKLVENTDYTVVYKDNIQPGTATLIIVGMGDYTGSVTKTFRIYKPGEAEKDLFVDSNIVRMAGDTRYETALETADALKQSMGIDAFNYIIVADGNNYPDALAGSYLAKVKKAPLILVDQSGVSEKQIREYIKENLNEDGTVYILGGTDVVTSRFERSLKSINVKRLAGETRYETNLEILEESGVSDEDFLACTGEGFADSLSASAVGKPILLVDNRGLTKQQKTYLDKAAVDDVYLIGGADVVSKKVGRELQKYDQDDQVTRIAGDNRYKTSIAVAKKFFPDKCDTAVLAYGMKFPDGLAGGPLAISLESPLLLVEDTAYADAKTYAQKAGIKKLAVLGGTDVIADKTANMIVK